MRRWNIYEYQEFLFAAFMTAGLLMFLFLFGWLIWYVITTGVS